MGFGDNLMATGMARGAAARGKRIAFGDGTKIIWDYNSPLIFQGNPNIAQPGTETHKGNEWVAFHRGNRIYNEHDREHHKWIWNYDFRATPGQVFFSPEEQHFANSIRPGFVLIEPNVPANKTSSPNKNWPFKRYEEIARRLTSAGIIVRQFVHGGRLLENAKHIKVLNFRHALAVEARAQLYIGPEGGLHHGAAAFGVPGVVIFGGFIPPVVTGYPIHTNLTGGAEACGSLNRCEHCIEALNNISLDDVHHAALEHITINEQKGICCEL